MGAGQRAGTGRGVPPPLAGVLPLQAGLLGQAGSEEGARERVWMVIPEWKVLAIGRIDLRVWGLHLGAPTVCSSRQSYHTNPV